MRQSLAQGKCGPWGVSFRMTFPWGARGAQSVKHPTVDFGSGRDLTNHELDPLIGLCAGSVEPAWDSQSLSLSLSLSLSALPPHVLSLCLSLTHTRVHAISK